MLYSLVTCFAAHANDRHFTVICLYCLVTALKSLLDVLDCRMNALDELSVKSQVIACIRGEKCPGSAS